MPLTNQDKTGITRKICSACGQPIGGGKPGLPKKFPEKPPVRTFPWRPGKRPELPKPPVRTFPWRPGIPRPFPERPGTPKLSPVRPFPKRPTPQSDWARKISQRREEALRKRRSEGVLPQKNWYK